MLLLSLAKFPLMDPERDGPEKGDGEENGVESNRQPRPRLGESEFACEKQRVPNNTLRNLQNINCESPRVSDDGCAHSQHERSSQKCYGAFLFCEVNWAKKKRTSDVLFIIRRFVELLCTYLLHICKKPPCCHGVRTLRRETVIPCFMFC